MPLNLFHTWAMALMTSSFYYKMCARSLRTVLKLSMVQLSFKNENLMEIRRGVSHGGIIILDFAVMATLIHNFRIAISDDLENNLNDNDFFFASSFYPLLLSSMTVNSHKSPWYIYLVATKVVILILWKKILKFFLDPAVLIRWLKFKSTWLFQVNLIKSWNLN